MRASAIFLVGIIATFVGLPGTPLGAAPVPKHLMKEPEGDLAKLQGKWKVKSIRVGPNQLLFKAAPVPAEREEEFTWEFRGDKISCKNLNGTIKLSVVEGVKRVAITNTKAMDNLGQPVKEENVTFGYVLQGDNLTLATTYDSKFPIDPTKPGETTITVILTRVKEK